MIDKPLDLMHPCRQLKPIVGVIARSWQYLDSDNDSMDMPPNRTDMATEGTNRFRRNGSSHGSGQFGRAVSHQSTA